MIKYKILSKKEKELEASKPLVVNTDSLPSLSKPISKQWDKTQTTLEAEIEVAYNRGFIPGADVVVNTMPYKPHKIEKLVTDPEKVTGYAKPYFISLVNGTFLYHPDELILIEPEPNSNAYVDSCS